MHELLDEPVDVVVSFAEHRVAPRRLRWQGRDYDLTRVNLVHAMSEGTKRVFYFSVSDATNDFKLRFDTDLLEWRLMELYTD